VLSFTANHRNSMAIKAKELRDRGGATAEEWHRFRAAIDTLSERQSLTQIAFAMGKDNRGWAKAAYHRMSLVSLKDVEKAEAMAAQVIRRSLRAVKDEEVAVEETKAEAVEVATPEPRHRKKRQRDRINSGAKLRGPALKFFAKMIRWLTEDIGMRRVDVAMMAGLKSAGSIHRYISGDNKSVGHQVLVNLCRSILTGYLKLDESDVARIFHDAPLSVRALLGEEGLTPPEYRPVVAAPDPVMAPEAVSKDRDRWAWLDEVQESLLAIALRIEEAGAEAASSAPESFRGSLVRPYVEKREAVERLMEEFRR
jgi:hypothetical protein